MNGLIHIAPTLLQRQRRLLPLDNHFFLLQMPRPGWRTSKILSFNYLRPLCPSLLHLKKSQAFTKAISCICLCIPGCDLQVRCLESPDSWIQVLQSLTEGAGWGLGNCSVSQVCEFTFKRMSRAPIPSPVSCPWLEGMTHSCCPFPVPCCGGAGSKIRGRKQKPSAAGRLWALPVSFPVSPTPPSVAVGI